MQSILRSKFPCAFRNYAYQLLLSECDWGFLLSSCKLSINACFWPWVMFKFFLAGLAMGVLAGDFVATIAL